MLEKDVFLHTSFSLKCSQAKTMSAFVLTASRVAENRQIRKSTKEILRS